MLHVAWPEGDPIFARKIQFFRLLLIRKPTMVFALLLTSKMSHFLNAVRGFSAEIRRVKTQESVLPNQYAQGLQACRELPLKMLAKDFPKILSRVERGVLSQ